MSDGRRSQTAATTDCKRRLAATSATVSFPRWPGWVFILRQGCGVHLGAVAGEFGGEVAAAADAAGIDKVFVEVIDELADAAIP